MDIKGIKVELAGMLGTLLKIDPLTGEPYDDYRAGETVRANAQAPFSLAETDLPTWCIFAGQATYPFPPDRSENRLAKEDRDFSCVLYVCVTQTGIDGEAERKIEPYIDAARLLIQRHALLYDGVLSQRVPGILHAGLVRDEGIIQTRYGDDPVAYGGLKYVIRIQGLNNNGSYGNE
jgi:hypothetical protein